MGILKSAVVTVVFAVLLNILVPRLLKTGLPVHIEGEGKTNPLWQHVVDVFRLHIESGLEPGAGFALYHKGEPVVTVVGGYSDPDIKQKWRLDSLPCHWSCTKGVGAVTIAKLYDMGHIDYDKPVAAYWPEFKKHGNNITVKMLLNHQVGLANPPYQVSIKALAEDPQKVTDMMLDMEPAWEPGKRHGYHALTMGIFMDQLVRLTDPKQRNLATFFREEIAIPLGIEYYIGMPRSEHYRAVRQMPASISPSVETFWMFYLLATDVNLRNMWASWLDELQALEGVNNLYTREIPFASAFGFGTVESLAKMYSIIANGGKTKDGKVLLKPETIRMLSSPSVTGRDVSMSFQNQTAFNRGFIIHNAPGGRYVMGHEGYGGQMTYADIDNDLAWSYVTNHPATHFDGKDPRFASLEKAVYDTLGKIQKKN